MSVNITLGCAQRCAFCCIRAQPFYPGDDVVYLFTNTAKLLKAELAGGRRKPRAVYVSPATDPFPPMAEVQAATAQVVDTVARHGVECWLMTRGYIRPSVLEVFAAHRDRVKVTVGLTTLDRRLQRLLEPLAAPPRLRLRQIAQLRARGIGVKVSLEPLIPGLTDTRSNLQDLLEALAERGVRHVSTSYLFMRSRIQDNLLPALAALGWDQPVLEAFAEGPILSSGGLAAARYLPKPRRQRGYASLMALGANYGITVSVCATTNPDFYTPKVPAPDSASQEPLFSRQSLAQARSSLS